MRERLSKLGRNYRKKKKKKKKKKKIYIRSELHETRKIPKNISKRPNHMKNTKTPQKSAQNWGVFGSKSAFLRRKKKI